MTGEEQARQTAEKFRVDLDEKKLESTQKMNEVNEEINKTKTQQLAKDNEEMRRLMSESAGIGAEDLSGSLPILKIYTANKSADDVLADGSRPHDGWFLHKATGREWEDVYFHPLKISRGFYAHGVPDPKTGVKPVVFNNILAGLVLNDNDYTPFIMYFTGTKLQNLWNFRDQIRPIIKRKVQPIPMFCFTAHMVAEKFKTQNFGLVWVAKLDYERDANGQEPQIDVDLNRFKWLKSVTEKMIQQVDEIILLKEVDKMGNPIEHSQTGTYIGQEEATVITEEPPVAEPKGPLNENVNPNDIPF